jgi:hypothetical protein
MLQIVGSPTCSSERVRELQENTTCFIGINHYFLFCMQFYTLPERCAQSSFHDEIVDRIDMRNPSNVFAR